MFERRIWNTCNNTYVSQSHSHFDCTENQSIAGNVDNIDDLSEDMLDQNQNAAVSETKYFKE